MSTSRRGLTLLVDALLVKRARLLHWLFFFVRPQTSSCKYHLLVHLTRFTLNPVVPGSSRFFSQKLFRAFAKADKTEGSHLSYYTALCHFFPKLFCLQRVPQSFFLISCSKINCQKAERVSHFSYFSTMKLFNILIFRFLFFLSKLMENS